MEKGLSARGAFSMLGVHFFKIKEVGKVRKNLNIERGLQKTGRRVRGAYVFRTALTRARGGQGVHQHNASTQTFMISCAGPVTQSIWYGANVLLTCDPQPCSDT